MAAVRMAAVKIVPVRMVAVLTAALKEAEGERREHLLSLWPGLWCVGLTFPNY